ncbi:MAG: hypothetical protein Q8M03_03870 [Legionella sp.]|nr:hypothetical protein [Legionella sp.]
MGFELKAYGPLKEHLDVQIKKLVKHHCGDDAVVADLEPIRRSHVYFLQAAVKKIDGLEFPNLDNDAKKDAERSRILGGLMLIFVELVNQSYSYLSPDNSCFRDCLKDALGLSDQNLLDSNSHCLMVSAAMKFIADDIFNMGLTTEPLREKHSFSDIPKLRLQAIWSAGVTSKAEAENGIFKDAETALKKIIQKQEDEAAAVRKAEAAARKKETKGWSLFGGSKKDLPEVKVIDKEAMANLGSTSTP